MNLLKSIFQFILVLAILAAVICLMSDLMLETHIYQSIFSDYYYEDDESYNDDWVQKVIYNGTVEELVSNDLDKVRFFLNTCNWEEDEGFDVCRIECDDYVIMHYMEELYYWDEDWNRPMGYTYMTPLPQDVVKHVANDSDIDFLVIDQSTGITHTYSLWGLEDWLGI